jgi:outer membrane protein
MSPFSKLKTSLALAAVQCLLSSPGWSEPYQPKIHKIEVPAPIVLPIDASAVQPTEAPQVELSIKEAVQIALRKQTAIKIAEAQAKAAESRTDQIRSGQNFKLGVGGTYTDVLVAANPFAGFGGAFGGGAAPNFNQDSGQANVTLRKLLFDFQHTRDLVQQSEELAKASAAGTDKARLDTVFQVRQGFFQTLQSQRLVQVQEANLVNRRRQLEQAQARFKAGLGLPLDVSRTQAAVAEAVLNLTQARNDAQIGLVTLATSMGIDPRTPLKLSEKDLAILPVVNGQTAIDKPETLYQKALELRPEMTQARSNLAAQNHGLNAAHTTSAPLINVSLGYVAGIRPIAAQTNAINLIFSINYDLFDGGLQDAKVREAEATLEATKAQLENIGQGIISEVSQAYLRMKSAEQKIQTAELQEQNASESFRLAEGRYKVGLGILLDVLDAQASLLTAQTNRVNALTQLELAKASLARSVGLSE